jgi:DNA-binding transcriptional ArsR family regulator
LLWMQVVGDPRASLQPAGPAEEGEAKVKKCHRCRGPYDSRFSCCDTCLVFERVRMKALRDEARDLGLCVMCRKLEARPAGKICEPCYERSVYWDLKRIAEARSNGLCYRCKSETPSKGKKTCASCRRKLRTYGRDRLKREREADRHDTHSRILDALQLVRSADLETLSMEVGLSPRTLLRHLPELVSNGNVSRVLVDNECSESAVYILKEASYG